MTGNRGQLPYLRLVEPTEKLSPTESNSRWDGVGVQNSLFSDANAQTLGFIEVSEMEPSTLVALLQEAKPKYIFDLRQVPEFTRGKLSRRSIFSLFESLEIKYFDVSGYLGTKSPRDTAYNPRLLIPNIMKNLVIRPQTVVGPVLFFLDPYHMSEAFIEAISIELPSQAPQGWLISVWEKPKHKHIEKGGQSRDIVFISHANPQDNDIARWLASRLALQGYKVWTDITRLVGGETFWDTIEDIIRHRSAAVIALLSSEGHEKPGVLDEINIAVSVERQLKIDGFVIPVRIDELPYSNIRANIARKNVIDGSRNLSDALQGILTSLINLNVPNANQVNAGASLAHVAETFGERGVSPDSRQWDTLVHNQLKIIKWPTALRKYQGPKPTSVLGDSFVAVSSGPGGTFTFATLDELEQATDLRGTISRAGEIVMSAVLAKDVGQTFRDNPQDVYRSLAALVRSGWDEACRRKGMLPYNLSNGGICWYPPTGFAPKNRVTVSHISSRERLRALVGVSKKKKVYWHFGLEAKVFVSDQSLRLKPHIIFTEDGIKPIDSSARQHALRRSFCKNWWNDRWRDLLAAFLQFLAGSDETWSLPVSPSQKIVLSGKLVTTSAVSCSDSSSTIGVIDEPRLNVGFDQQVLDPRKGLSLFGPVRFDRNPSEIRLGVVGTREGIELFKRWCAEFRKPVQLSDEQHAKGEVAFPGFSAAFGANWPLASSVALAISRTDLLNTIRSRDRHQAVYKAVDLFVSQIERSTRDDDPSVDIWFIVIPDEVYLYGRPNAHVPSAISIAPTSHVSKRIARRFSGDSPSLFEEDNHAAKIYEHHADFHHQLKARLLQRGAVTQLFRESSIQQTLAPDRSSQTDEDEEDLDRDLSTTLTSRRMQSPSDVAWNIGTASFFKAGGRPWSVATARPGVCYVGLIFKRDELGGKGHACCGAQLFLDSGEGIVFKGTLGPWYSKDTKQFHLTYSAAEALMSNVITAFKTIHSIVPREIFVHGRTRFSDEELSGFSAACAGKSDVTGVRITRTNDFKLFSLGDLPVRRGTYQKLTSRVGLLWTSGFVESLNTYQGRETPNPLRVEICGHSEARLETVLGDIMTLTKMNFNSAIFADGYPVTMRFADAIGDVLMATGDREIPPLPFRHYI